MNLLLIGGVPSSGSTFLVYLLAKTGYFWCLPETGLFTQGRAFCSGSEQLPNNLNENVPWVCVKTKVRQALGWDVAVENFQEFSYSPIKILEDFLPNFHGKTIVEKTPENIFAFNHYLRNDVTRKVVITLRDLESVCFSLMKRKFTILEAMTIWFGHTFESWRLIKKYPDRVLPLFYEDICYNPENSVSRIAKFFNHQADFTLTRDSSREKDQFIIKQSTLNLSSRYWSKEVVDSENSKISKLSLGAEFNALSNAIFFKTHQEGLVNPHILNIALQKNLATLKKITPEESISADVFTNFFIVESLLKYYPIFIKNP